MSSSTDDEELAAYATEENYMSESEAENGEDTGFDGEDKEDKEYEQYERDFPETSEEREVFNADTPVEDSVNVYVNRSAEDRDRECSIAEQIGNTIQKRYSNYEKELMRERQAEKNLVGYDSSDDEVQADSSRRLKRLRRLSDDDESDDANDPLFAKRRKDDIERKKKMKRTGKLDGFFKKVTPNANLPPDLTSSDEEDSDAEVTSDPTVLPETELVADAADITLSASDNDYEMDIHTNSPPVVNADVSSGDPEDPGGPSYNDIVAAGEPITKYEILKNLKSTDDYAHTGQKLLLDLKLKSHNKPAVIHDATECYEYLVPINIFDTKVGNKEIRAWHRDQMSFIKFQTAYLMGYLATRCQAAGENVSVHFWPLASNLCDHKSPISSFSDIFNSQHNTLYFLHIICYDKVGLQAFSKYMTYFCASLPEDGKGPKGHAKTSMPKDPFKMGKYMSNPESNAIGSLAAKCASRLPKSKWTGLKSALLKGPADFASGLVLLAIETCNTVIDQPRKHEYIACRVSTILPVSKIIGGGIEGADQIEEAPIMKEMFSLKNVLNGMLAAQFPDLVQEMQLNRPEVDEDDEPVAATAHVMWPDEHPAYHINTNNILNLPQVFDAISSSSFPLSRALVTCSEGSRTGNQELIVDNTDGLVDIYDMLKKITGEYNGEDAFSKKNILLRLVLAKSSDIELPWHKSLKRYMRYIEDNSIDLKRFNTKLTCVTRSGYRNIGNVFPDAFWQHCQHGGQIGNIHTPMTKLLYIGLAGLLTNPQHAPAGMIFYGMYSAGKSFMMELLQEMFPDGSVEVCAGGSVQSLLQNVSKMIKMMHEHDKNIEIGAEGVDLRKAFFQAGSQVYERNEQTPEGNYRVQRLEYKNDAIFCRATNSGLYKIDPAFLSRNVVCNIGSQNPTTRSKEALALSAQTKASETIRNSFNESFLITFFYFHYFDMITSYCGDEIENKLYAFIYAKVGDMHPALNIANPRTGGFVRNFARVHTLMTTVQACLHNLECFTPREIRSMKECLGDSPDDREDLALIAQLKKMSSRDTISKRAGMEIHTHLMCHMCRFDGAASIFFGMSIPFDTTASISAQEVLMVLKDLCYRGANSETQPDYIKINYKKGPLKETIIETMDKDYRRRRDDETITTALQELGLRVVSNGGIDSAAIVFQDSSVEISKKLLQTTTTKHEQMAFNKLVEKNLVFKIQENLPSDTNPSVHWSERWKYDENSKFNYAGKCPNDAVMEMADRLKSGTDESEFFFIPYSTATNIPTGEVMSNLMHNNPRVKEFTEKFHSVLPKCANEFSETQGLVITVNTYNTMKSLDTSLGSSSQIGEIHVGFSKVAQIVGLFEGESEKDEFLVVEPQVRSELRFGTVSKETAQKGREPFQPSESDYRVKNARYIPTKERLEMPLHVQNIINACEETRNPWIEFAPGENNEELIEREVFEKGTLGSKIHSQAVKDIIFARISKAGQQRAFKKAASAVAT